MQTSGYLPDAVAYTTLIHAFAKVGMVDQATLAFQEAQRVGWLGDPVMFYTMIQVYAKAGMAEQRG